MKTSTFKRLAGWISISALALGLIAATQSAQAANDVRNSRHNLSSSRPVVDALGEDGQTLVGDIYVTDTDQVCVFCHTPHGANTSFAVPLWNKATPLSVYTAYSMTGSSSIGSATVSGMSLACLTCHDGTQAMDNMLNTPGLGTAALTGDTLTAGYSWSAASVDVTLGALSANAPPTGGPVLGTDLSNDHPIGMTYCGMQTVAGTCDGAEIANFVTPGTIGTAQGTSGGSATEIKLFGGTAATGNGTVECGSCHDPHGTGNQLFLRKTAAGSAICLACHVK